MLFEEGHPLISREDWLEYQSFQRSPLCLSYSECVNRENLNLPYWFLPLALGVLVAGPGFLRPHYIAKLALASRGWSKRSADCNERKVGKTRLRVRRTNDRRYWIISRWLPGVPMYDTRSETIVCLFG